MIIVPIVLCKNEEIWIERVLRPFANLFPHVIVADTGSTDSTLEQIAKVPNIYLLKYDHLTAEQVGQCRGWMQAEARSLFSASHVWLVDADELYPTKYIRFILENMMPENAMSGFTYGLECMEKDNGECWFYGVGVSRQAIFSVNSQWRGVYPFESPDTFVPGHPTNYYWSSPKLGHNFYHLHGMCRSTRDADVDQRLGKRFQFSMQDRPDIQPKTLWLKSEREYRDEQ